MNTLRSYLQQSAGAEASLTAHVLRMMPAFPKPHLYKLDGAWYCTRHAYQDEFVTTQGNTPIAAFDGGELMLDLMTPCDVPTWAQELGHA